MERQPLKCDQAVADANAPSIQHLQCLIQGAGEGANILMFMIKAENSPSIRSINLGHEYRYVLAEHAR